MMIIAPTTQLRNRMVEMVALKGQFTEAKERFMAIQLMLVEGCETILLMAGFQKPLTQLLLIIKERHRQALQAQMSILERRCQLFQILVRRDTIFRVIIQL